MQKQKLATYIGNEKMNIVEAMQKMDANGSGILFITSSDNALIGTLTDGDIRRWIIKTGSLNTDIMNLVNRSPRYLHEGAQEKAIDFMIRNKIKAVPILDGKKCILDIILNSYSQLDQPTDMSQSLKKIPVIIMAGGKGTRLYPYTKILPKPLIPIGDVPIIERIMNRFFQYGVDKFFVTINYKKEMIKSYFAESKPPYEIQYIEEEQPMGTAGSIRLINEKFKTPVIVTNCDILIETDYESVLEYHFESGNDLTIISSLKNVTIPYGVLHSKEQGIIASMEEKPQLSYFINTGMYIVNPGFLNWIPENKFFHMTDLAEKMLMKGKQVGMYPISENSFLDMGEFEEMKKMEERINNGHVK